MKKITLCLALILTLIAPSIVFATTNNSTEPVAKIGEVEYASLAEAVAAVPTNGTETIITLLRNVEEGAGFKTVSGQKIVIDFDGYTYDAGLPTVGSTGTETNGCQLLKGSTVTFKNGTLTSKNEVTSKKVIQNYGNLTLKDMTIDGTAPKINYAVSLNCGKVEILGNTSIKTNKGVKAFDACWAPNTSYTNGVQVTVNTTGKITGDIELGLWNPDDSTENAKTTLTIKNMQHEGNILGNNALLKNVTISGGTFNTDVSAYVGEGFACKKISNSYKVGKEHSITVKKVEGGTVTADKTKAITGEKVTLTVKIENGYKLDGFSLEGKYLGSSLSAEQLSFAMLNDDIEIVPVFTKVETTLSSSVVNSEKVQEILKETLANNEELAEAIQGKDVEIKVEVKSKEASKTEKENIENAVNKKDSDLTVVNYVEITIYVKDKDNGDELGKLETVKESITFTVPVPENLPEVAEGYERVFYIVRNHNGEIELLDATEKNGKLEFESDKFSTYAVAYKDVEKTSEEVKNDNTSSNVNEEKVPQTGDNVIAYVAIAVVAVAGIAVAMKMRRK